jgi:dynein heavy chain
LHENFRLGGYEPYKVPPEGPLKSYYDYIDTMEHNDPTKIFGLHDNALITSAINDSNNLLSTCLYMLPRTSSGGDKTSEQIISHLCVEIHHRMPELFDIEAANKKYPMKYEESMNTVLIQELIRFNRLLNVVKVSTLQLRDAISGLITMSAELEKVFNSLFDNKVPEMWNKAAYPSLKPLAQWIDDFISRLNFMQNWIDQGPPKIFWISGFFFTQSFLTGIMQNFARQNKIPIDTVCFDFEVVGDKNPELSSGCYIRGLYLDGGKWDEIGNYLAEPVPKILYYLMPTVLLKPIRIAEKPKKHTYECPVYKTSKRQGVLSTTGHSTNFVLTILLNISPAHTESHWIKRGTALLTQLDY